MNSDSRYTERTEYIKTKVVSRRRLMKQMAIDYKGGKCSLCGYSRCKRALSFHHVNPDEKSFGIAYRGFSRSWEKLRPELDKCVLLCANCHMEIEDNLITLTSGAIGSAKSC